MAVTVNDNPTLESLATSEAIDQFLLVTRSGDTYALCDATEVPYGIAMRDAASGALLAPRRLFAGSAIVTASEAIAQGDLVATAAGGKVQKVETGMTDGARVIGRATQAAAADGDWISVEPVAPYVVQTTIAALTDSSGGTADGTVAAISGSGADADINNNFAELATKVNAIVSALDDAGITI